jgi:hypothetical protein
MEIHRLTFCYGVGGGGGGYYSYYSIRCRSFFQEGSHISLHGFVTMQSMCPHGSSPKHIQPKSWAIDNIAYTRDTNCQLICCDCVREDCHGFSLNKTRHYLCIRPTTIIINILDHGKKTTYSNESTKRHVCVCVRFWWLTRKIVMLCIPKEVFVYAYMHILVVHVFSILVLF